MSKLKKINLNEISNRQIDEKAMCRIVGGSACQCGCKYEGQPGGSTTSANNSANTAGGLHSGSCPVDKQALCHIVIKQACKEYPLIQDALCPPGGW